MEPKELPPDVAEKILDADFQNTVKKGEYVPLDQVREEWIGLVAQATSILRAKFENELPPVLSGLDATGIQAECRKAIDEVLRCLHEG